jgi:hypothetical protein
VYLFILAETGVQRFFHGFCGIDHILYVSCCGSYHFHIPRWCRGGSGGVDLDDSFEDNVDRAGSRLFSQMILTASNVVTGSAAHDEKFRELPRKRRHMVRASTAYVVSVIEQVTSDTLQWSDVDGVVVFNPCFLHTVRSAVVGATMGTSRFHGEGQGADNQFGFTAMQGS